jgi:type I restriction enzyme S subunit
MIDLSPSQLDTVKQTLARHVPGCEVRAFGSRVKWTAKSYSDLDLAIVGTAKLKPGQLADLSEAFAESDLPFRVDLLDWHAISESFRKVIEEKFEVVQAHEPASAKMEEWNTTTLGECAAWLSGGTPFKGNDAFWSGTIPWVSAKDMKSFRLHDAEDHISPLAVGSGGKLVPAGTILLLVRGMTLHNDVPICMVMREMAFNQDIKALRPARNVDGEFLAYWLLAHKPDLLASVDSAGHGTGRLVTDTLKDKRVMLPPFPEQKAIARILGTLDDKIELNRRMNATLEAMARALFQSWFADFDPVHAKAAGRQPSGMDTATAALFPAALQDSDLGKIPNGWEACPLSQKIEILSGGTPKTSEPTYWDGDIPWYSVKDAPTDSDVWVIQTEKNITKLGVDNSAAKILPTNTTIISARGTVGKLALTGAPMAMNQSCYGIRGASGNGDYFTYFCLRQAVAGLQQRTHGTVFDTITRQTFETQNCVFPPREITVAFDKAVTPILSKIRTNLHQSRTLATLRDTLLPKLLSGESMVSLQST